MSGQARFGRPVPGGGAVGDAAVGGAGHDVRAVGRATVAGAAAGLVVALPIGALMGLQGMMGDGGVAGWPLLLVDAVVTGAALGAAAPYRRGGVAVTASSGALLGILGWVLFVLTVAPLLRGQPPTWSVASAAAGYRLLVGAVLHGATTGVVLHGVLARRARTGRPSAPASGPEPLAKVVIVGGGFAGVAAAQRFERLVLRGAPVDVTVISDSNFLLFTPMLAEVASSALEPAHISAPVRVAAANTRFRHGAVEHVDTDRRLVEVLTGSGVAQRVPYDHLVLAVGSVPHFLDLPGVEDHSLTMKDLADATNLRDHVIELLERTDDAGADPAERTRLLTFVVAGGGFAGAETVAELFDLVHGVLHFFPGIGRDEPRFVLVHSRDRILPELSAELGDYARERLEARGIEFRMGVRVAAADADAVVLSDGATIPTGTFVWTAGTRPSPVAARLDGDHAGNGALMTDPTMRVTGLDGVWAVGDCARIPDVDSDGAAYPPTAQHALRQGKVVADNIAATLAGREPVPFRFSTIGVLVALGHRTAAAEIRGRRFSGLLAWVLWRGIYLVKLPGTEKRLRVLLDWLLDLAFPRDIVIGATSVPDRAVGGRTAEDDVSPAPAGAVPVETAS